MRASQVSPEPDAQSPASGVARLLHLPADPVALAGARRYVSAAALACGLEGPKHYQFLYAVNEALTNAIKHGVPDGLGMITVSVVYDSSAVTVTIRDPGHPASGTITRAAGAQGGRGLGLMLAMTDALQMQSDDSGTTVSLSKRLPTSCRPNTASVP